MTQGFSCSTVCEIFLDQGLNPCPLHWQAESPTGPPGKNQPIFRDVLGIFLPFFFLLFYLPASSHASEFRSSLFYISFPHLWAHPSVTLIVIHAPYRFSILARKGSQTFRFTSKFGNSFSDWTSILSRCFLRF